MTMFCSYCETLFCNFNFMSYIRRASCITKNQVEHICQTEDCFITGSYFIYVNSNMSKSEV